MTYSIVAKSSDEFGVAVQSHWFSVGSLVPWALSGVGAVATQAFVEVSYGPSGLDLMASGISSSSALAALIAADTNASVRQVAMVDSSGAVAAHTGGNCIAEAGHVTGDEFSCQANMMLRSSVPAAMADAFTNAPGDLSDRLLAALDAAEADGGDIRGRQSAALLVVRAEASGKPWADQVVDLRVEDAAEPLVELRRLVGIKRAYEQMNQGDEALAIGDSSGAAALYASAQEAAPGNPEFAFWRGVTIGATGDVAAARPWLAKAYALSPDWAELLRRLPAAGLFPNDPALIEALTSE